MKRRGVIGLLAVTLLSILVLNTTKTDEYRVIYHGEDAHTLLLITARNLCKDPSRVNESLQKISPYIGPLKVKSFSITIPYNFSQNDRGVLICVGSVVTNLGSDHFTLNYTYEFIGVRIDPFTGRILRLYRVNAFQTFKIASYPYPIRINTSLFPLCPHDYINGSLLAIRGAESCTLIDKWGLSLVIRGG